MSEPERSSIATRSTPSFLRLRGSVARFVGSERIARAALGLVVSGLIVSGPIVSGPAATSTSGAGSVLRAVAQDSTANEDGLPSSPADFELESTSGTRRTLRDARGRVVIVFYEDREHTSQNHAFKELLHRFIVDNELRNQTRTFAIANVSEVDGVMRDIARAAINTVANQYGIEILVDWDRALQQRPFSLRDGAANVMLIDRRGRIRWRHTGAMGDDDRRSFFRWFRRLLREPAN